MYVLYVLFVTREKSQNCEHVFSAKMYTQNRVTKRFAQTQKDVQRRIAARRAKIWPLLIVWLVKLLHVPSIWCLFSTKK